MSQTSPRHHDEHSEAIGFAEFVMLCAALMATNALSIDPMLPALPTIGRDLAIAQPNDRQLIISLYFMGLSVGSLLFGILSDRFGRKSVLGATLALFVLSTIACALSQSFAMLLAARMCAGFFAGGARVITIGIIRDRFHGDAMARVMSLIFTVFIIIPVLAPSFGQMILWFAPWRWIFWVLAILGAAITSWMLARMPETLHPENRLPIAPRAIAASLRAVVAHRSAIGYMLASGVVMSGLIGFIVSVQQIFFDTFHASGIFPLAFAGIAGSMGVGSLVNSRLVQRFGARRMSQSALIGLIAVNLAHGLIVLAGWEGLVSFILFQSLTMLSVAFTASNFSAISMEPFAKGAGVASSFQAFLTTIISVIFGGAIGHGFDGTTLPLTMGIFLCGTIALLLVLWAERGRLFTRPGHAAQRDRVSESVPR
ncbi:DHA1 family bicyclomycin/chloramphenicol resistance-like MFS transporter [Sphingobium fontiphilum]|uniref:DHA1 family bicyclomycin/chloramphenicol resistance-like MFS transporter n=1 Tax=Sphingobium fontiphilum TaxID=944425 RepID=A0A7W6DID9_9SPHN|nr:multidrug effflux MFS transporter [Sphingobium fontiphilum]MBB3983618.1 DHA1 family bicyclomycin/chloramphenicol resistance-like MFS transporter [Sphingobium fontiphilum]